MYITYFYIITLIYNALDLTVNKCSNTMRVKYEYSATSMTDASFKYNVIDAHSYVVLNMLKNLSCTIICFTIGGQPEHNHQHPLHFLFGNFPLVQLFNFVVLSILKVQ
jgi:hypothetical protein